MNGFQHTLLLCVIQVTLLSLVACLLHLALRRRSPAIRSSLALSALVVILGVSALSFGSWPNWTSNWWTQLSQVEAVTAPASTTVTTPSPQPAANQALRELAPAELQSAWQAAWEGFRRGSVQPGSEMAATQTSYPVGTILGFLFAAGLLVGMARLIGGWLAVRRMRSHSRRLQEPLLREEVEILQAEIGCTVPIELRESIRLATAATVGWRHPIVLLPTGWKDWTPLERRAVLAHEIAHIHHRDYLAWLFAQASVVLHFYHPLVHWLASRLRIDQELAADAAAAPLAGGRQTYLETLAQLALRHSDRRLSWPIRAFLPTRHTFLRRLEMLRDPRQLSARSPARARWLTFGVMLAAGILVAGLRGPVVGNSSFAFAADESSATPANAPLSLDYVPRDAVVVVGTRPAALLNNVELKSAFAPMLEGVGERQDDTIAQQLGVSPDQIEEMKVIVLMNDDPAVARPADPIVVLRMKQPGQPALIVNKLIPQSQKEMFDGQAILTNPNGKRAFAMPDDRTLIVAEDGPMIRRALIAGPEGSPSSAVSSLWKSVAGDDVAVVANVESLSLARADVPIPASAALFAPLWQKTKSAAAGLTVQDRFRIHGFANTATVEDAQRVKDTLGAALVLARNSLSGLRASASRMPAEQSAMILRMADVADGMLEKAEISQSETQVTLLSQGDSAEAAKLVATLAPAVVSARTAARRSQEINNLRNVNLALHSYNAAHGRFPASAVVGPDGKTVHSWRVEILPYLDQASLYNEYKLDEPWNSENNLKVLDKMPAFFRSPMDPPNSTNASYFVFTGEHTVFGNPEGTKLAEITDGFSQTLSVVEAKRDIPWTKPEDLVYDAGKPVPELGGRYEEGFIAAFSDGSVKLISKKVDDATLRKLITKDGREPVEAF